MKDIYSLYISLAALIVSAFSLGWNFYKDVILKPRLGVSISISNLSNALGNDLVTFISVRGVNHGPGAITCNGLLAIKKSWLFCFWKKLTYYHIVEDYTNPIFDRFPKKLEIGDTINLSVPYNPEAFLCVDPSCVGIRDTFGRMHWASRKSLKEAKKEFFKEFKKKETHRQ